MIYERETITGSFVRWWNALQPMLEISLSPSMVGSLP